MTSETTYITIPVGPLREIKWRVLAATLVATKGNRAQAARLLGVNPKTLWRWMREPS